MIPSSATALSALSDFNAKRQSAQDIYNTANTQYDVGGGTQRVSALQGQVGNLQNSLEAVDPSVTGRTTGTFTTEGQRSALVNREQAPIASNLNKSEANLGTEKSNLSTSQGLASQLASAMIAGDQTKYQGLLDQYNSAVASEKAIQDQKNFEAQQAAAKAENDRQYSLAVQQNAIKSSASTKTSSADTKAAVLQHVTQGLASSVGKDGHVSEETWAAALNDYQAAGLGNVRQFWQQYGRYVNGKYGNTYAGYAQR